MSAAYGSYDETGNNLPLTFRRCTFDPSVNVTALCDWRERESNLVFEACNFSNRIGTLTTDNRGGSPNNAFFNSGATYLDEQNMPKPVYTNWVPSNYTTHALNTEPEHSDKGFRAAA